ncbi:MAG TPA: glycosyltransferase family 39 protein [Candidatus Binatia bacterium]
MLGGTDRRLDLLLLALALALFFGFNLGQRALWSPVEGRYAEIPREMVVTGDYVTPRLNGVVYFEKPPLFYWLEALSIKLAGLSEWSFRLWPALFALLGCLIVYGAGRELFGPRAGLLASVVLATSPLYYVLGRVVAVDMALSFFLAAALLAFLLGVRAPPGPKRRRLLWSFYLCAALATLTKGLMGVVLPALVIGAWIALLGEWKILKNIYLPSGMVLFAAVAVPWHLVVAARNPEFAYFYFIREHFERYLLEEEGTMGQAWVYIPVLLVGLFPWVAFLFQSIKTSLAFTWSRRRHHKEESFLSLWAVVIFLFFSGSGSRLSTYVLPVLPPLALLIGRSFSEWWDGAPAPGFWPGVWAAAATMALLVLVGASAPQHGLERYSNWPSLEVPSDDATVPSTRSERYGDIERLKPYLYAQALLLLGGAAAAALAARRRSVGGIFSALAVTSALFLTVVDLGFPLLDDRRSVKSLALLLKPRLGPADEVATYRTYYQDLPVYLERRVSVVDWRGELAFGARIEDASGWMLDGPEFWRRWDGGKAMYALTDRENYERLRAEARPGIYLLAGNDYNVLLTNRLERSGMQ